MLVLTRKRKQRILIGDDIVIEIIEIRTGSVKLGITAPPEVRVTRDNAVLLMPRVVPDSPTLVEDEAPKG